MTYAPGSFWGDRAPISPPDLLAKIQCEARPGAGSHTIGLIMPSTFHKLQVRNQDLPAGAAMLLYCGIADLDAEPRHAGSKKALKQAIRNGIQSGMTWGELCAACPDFADVAMGAKALCAQLRAKGFTPSCWFTGGKGFRVVWRDPACFLRYKKGDAGVSNRVLDTFFHSYLGGECLAEVRKLCDFDKNIYDAGKGVKSDLQRHQDTKFWPLLVDFSDDGLQGMPMRRTERDQDLCRAIAGFWTDVLSRLPASWAAVAPVPEGGGDRARQTELVKRAGAPAGHARPAKRQATGGRAGAQGGAGRAVGGDGTGRRDQTMSEEELEEKHDKLVKLAGHLAAIHPEKCGGTYAEWMSVLFAVKNELGAVSCPDLCSKIHALLDDFSRIRAGYQSATDVEKRYEKIQPRDGSQPSTTIGTLIHYARQCPALALASPASADMRDSLAAAFDAKRSAERHGIHDRGDRKKREEAREEAHRHLLGLLFNHADWAATSWRWMAQCCACLAPHSDSNFIPQCQLLFIEKYRAVGVAIAPGELQSAFRAPTSHVYRKSLIKYVQNEVMELAGRECDGPERLPVGSMGRGPTAANTTDTDKTADTEMAEAGASDAGMGDMDMVDAAPTDAGTGDMDVVDAAPTDAGGCGETAQKGYFEIAAGDDAHAATIILNKMDGRLKNCGGRYFVRKTNSVVYEEGEEKVKNEIINMTKENLVIMATQTEKLHHYSKSTAKLNACIPRVLADDSITDDNFVDNLWRGNLRHIAFVDGVYSFREGRLVSLPEALRRRMFFTQDTRRPFPVASPELDRAKQELMERVVVPTLPDEDVRAFFLNCLARALAGEIPDKRWFACLGPRNCGKGILCKLLRSAFGPFVRAMNAENLVCRERAQDAAKAQSWMKPLEHTRLAYSNELRASSGTRDKTLDGELIKRLCSNGDEVELRTNHKDEIQVRLQASMFLFANDFPAIDPPDAYQTMVGFRLRTEFREPGEITDPSDPRQHNWRPKDHGIDAFIQRPDVVDAFTVLVLEHYTPAIQQPPPIVREDTASIRGPAAESQEERFRHLVQRTGAPADVLFYKEIRLAAEATGMGRLSDGKIDGFVQTLYGLKSMKPSKSVDGRTIQARGFKGLALRDAGPEESPPAAENSTSEHNQSVAREEDCGDRGCGACRDSRPIHADAGIGV